MPRSSQAEFTEPPTHPADDSRDGGALTIVAPGRAGGPGTAEAVAVAAAPDARGAGQLDVLVSDFARVLNSDLALVCEPDSDGRVGVDSAWGIDRPFAVTIPGSGGRRLGVRRPKRGGSEGCFVGRALVHGRPAFEILNPDRDRGLIRAGRVEVTHALAAPIEVSGDGYRRLLVAGFSIPPTQVERAFWVADCYARMIGLLAQYPDALGELSEQTRYDGLTGCLTYDGLRVELAREINRTARSALALSCCFIDLDGFKLLNSMHGHLRANEMLADVGLVLREGVRSCDTVARYGGDEFVAILPQTGATEAVLLAARLRGLIASDHADRFGGALSASIGVAQWAPGITVQQLLARADDAMFTAKARPGGVAAYDEANALAVSAEPSLPGSGPSRNDSSAVSGSM